MDFDHKESNVRKDDIYRSTINDNVKDKTLDGESNREDCEEENVHMFLY